MLFLILYNSFDRNKVTYLLTDFLSDAEGTSSGLLNREGIAVLPLLRKQFAKSKESQVSGK